MKNERTLVVIKPDGVQRSLIGEIIKRYERSGLKLVGVKMIVPTAEHIEKHYTLDPTWRRVTGEKTIKSYKDKGLPPTSEDPLAITAIITTTAITVLRLVQRWKSISVKRIGAVSAKNRKPRSYT